MAIVLEKSGDRHRIDLTKGGITIQGEIKINLDWSKGGFFKQIFSGATDLDLGCYYELKNGQKSLIDGLQFSHGRGGSKNQLTKQGCYTQAPWVWHQGDDRGGGTESGETILVNPNGIKELKTIVVYTFIYEGAAKWSDTNAVVKVSVPGSEDVKVEMGAQTSSRKFCVIARIDVNPDGSFDVQKLVNFFDGHRGMSEHFGWGFSFTPGSK